MSDQTVPLEPPPSYENSAMATTRPTPSPNNMPMRGPRLPLPLDMPVLNMLKGQRVILASASPRRKALLAQIGLTDLEIIPSTFPENLDKASGPTDYVLATASQKALLTYKAELDNAKKGDPALVIAADTIIATHFGDILEKPRSEADHITMLKTLRDTGPHRVMTAVVCVAPLESAQDPGYAMESTVEETFVHFDPKMTDEMILAYVKTREGADKAGGYAIQGIGSLLVERIEGTFDNVVGLPLRATLQTIEKTLSQNEEEELEDDAKPSLFGSFWTSALS